MASSSASAEAPYHLCGLVPHARQYQAVVIEQRALADHTYAVRVHCPELAREFVPGQFLMIRQRGTDPLLGRPFALYDTIVDSDGQVTAFEFAYHVVGKFTGIMSDWRAGTRVEMWGPLGNGFPQFSGQHLLCVGGGIGYTPFLAVTREVKGLRTYRAEGRVRHSTASGSGSPKVTLCYGVQTKSLLADLSDFENFKDFDVQISTDDGSAGRPGFVTETVADLLQGPDRPDAVYCCGPMPMMRAVAKLCQQANAECWVSLETPMACGFGACFSCVTRVKDESSETGWDYRRTCVEGPIFPADSLYWG